MPFFVSTLQNDFGGCSAQCIGHLVSLDRAKGVIFNNTDNISLGGKNAFCVIESVPEGLFPDVEAEWWFRWNGKEYVECAKPKGLKSFTNFSIGTASR